MTRLEMLSPVASSAREMSRVSDSEMNRGRFWRLLTNRNEAKGSAKRQSSV
eukprot:CAMPEP_0180181934 /NCGR_PEP_ID=MMETSP0986-20121125/40386_1 /TAXON_ID=697907 /ORGANISM="non described non described, Strain CCMP2293" /LENGTH=50 /DNA_ID=CAMNT_0022135247 /DNA_START=420 /DNA_END=572 /DNA_ORIENTATION=+